MDYLSPFIHLFGNVCIAWLGMFVFFSAMLSRKTPYWRSKEAISQWSNIRFCGRSNFVKNGLYYPSSITRNDLRLSKTYEDELQLLTSYCCLKVFALLFFISLPYSDNHFALISPISKREGVSNTGNHRTHYRNQSSN